jgi:ISXO2-like transposase domain
MSRLVGGTDYFSILERGISGVYHHVSHEHLPMYLAEFDFRYNARSGLGISDPQRAFNQRSDLQAHSAT